MKQILVTNDFCKSCSKLVKSNHKEEVHDLRTVLILLANDKPIPKKFHDHQLKNNEFRELHISGDVLLLYKYDSDKDTYVVSLKLVNITDHKNLSRESKRNDYEYSEVSTVDLHNITSSINLNSLDEIELNDFAESISDYASEYLQYGYILLDHYYIEKDNLHLEYNYYLFDADKAMDEIDFIVDLNRYNIKYISQLDKYIDKFSQQVANAFE